LQMPPAAVAAIEKLGADLAVARLRRKESLKTWAQRMGFRGPRFSAYRRVTREWALEL
jgi:hypothetical protein